jgi:hypothetical protein
VACVAGAGAGAGAGAVATGAATLTSPAPDPEDEPAAAAPPEAATAALVLAAVAASAASVLWSLPMMADRRTSVRALALLCLEAAVDELDVVALVVGTIVELTKALASPAPVKAIDVTMMDGRMRRRARERPSA